MRIDELKRESGLWEQEGIIDACQRERILALYPQKTSRAAGLVFAGIGAVLIGAGILLIFAFNWGRIPVPLKLFFAFLPLSLAIAYAAWTILKRYGSAAFRETAGIFLALGIYAAIALIGQIFHDPRDLPAFVLACSLVILPGAYMLKSSGAAAIYSAGAIYTSWQQPEAWASFLVCAAIIPFFIMKMRYLKTDKNTAPPNSIEYKFSLSGTLLLFSAVLVNIVLLVFYRTEEKYYFEPLSIILFCTGILFLLDACVKRFVLYNSRTKEQPVFFSPPQALAQAAVLIVLLISAAGSSSFLVEDWNEGRILFWRITIAMLIAAAAYFAAGFAGINRAGQGEGKAFAPIRKIEPEDLYFISCLVLQLSMPRIWIPSNALLFGLGVYSILLGGKGMRLKQLNFGMLLVMYLITLRFFDMDLGLLHRGIAFIILGIMFLACNVFFSRKKRSR